MSDSLNPMGEPGQRPGFFQRALVRGVALGCAIQITVCAVTGGFVMIVLNLNVYSEDAAVRRASWVLMGGALCAAAILVGVALRLRRLHKQDKARGVALSIPVAFALGMALAAGVFLLLLAMCRGNPL